MTCNTGGDSFIIIIITIIIIIDLWLVHITAGTDRAVLLYWSSFFSTAFLTFGWHHHMAQQQQNHFIFTCFVPAHSHDHPVTYWHCVTALHVLSRHTRSLRQFPRAELMSSTAIFCLPNSLKPTDIQYTLRKNREKQGFTYLITWIHQMYGFFFFFAYTTSFTIKQLLK